MRFNAGRSADTIGQAPRRDKPAAADSIRSNRPLLVLSQPLEPREFRQTVPILALEPPGASLPKVPLARPLVSPLKAEQPESPLTVTPAVPGLPARRERAAFRPEVLRAVSLPKALL